MNRSCRSKRVVAFAMTLALGLLGCGDEQTNGPSTEGGAESCPAPNRLVGDLCLAPGVQDNGHPAGVPPELCAEGFVHDGEAGCEPILPAEPCPVGQMALPGDSTCQPVMECDSGNPWGNIPVDGTTIYVDAAYDGGSSDGSEAQPFASIGAALDAASAGALIAVAAGSYPEAVLIDKPVRLWGECPAQVTLEGQGTLTGALEIRAGSSGTEVVGLAITSDVNGTAILVSGAEDVTLERLWIHQTTGRGLNVQDDLGPTSATVRHTLIEQNSEFGVFVSGSQVSLEGVVVRSTQPRASDLKAGRGISIQPNLSTGAPSSVTITAALIEDNHDVGVVVLGSQVSLEGVVVRGTLPRVNDQNGGLGIDIESAPSTDTPSSTTITASLIEDNHDVGVVVLGSQVSLEGVVVRGTQPRPSDQTFGQGISIQSTPLTGVPSSATVTASLIEQNHATGVIVSASQVDLEGVVVRDTQPRASDQNFGRGISIQPADAPSNATITGSLIEQNHEIGILVAGSQCSLEGVVVRATAARVSDGLFGDGLVVMSEPGPSAGSLLGCLLEDNARAGLSNFGAQVTIGDTSLLCNALNLAADPHLEQAFSFEVLDGNQCGCGEETGPCKAATTGLTPPAPLDE